VATSEGAATPVGDVADLVTSGAPRRLVAPAPTTGKDAPRTLRRSSRNAGRADEHTLLKAERVAKKRTSKVFLLIPFQIRALFQTLVG
jgi:hypothetical protein